MERVADYIIRAVREAGAAHLFMITGRGILYLTDAAARNPDISPVSTFHEQGASYAAMAYAAATGGLSACMVSTGCAAANAITACLCAWQDNLPVVFLSGNHILSENTRHTKMPIRTYGSQETDIIRMVESVTKYAVMITTPDSVVYETQKALYLAMEGRRGPVWIDVPLDVQNMRIEPSDLPSFTRPKDGPAEPGQDSDVDSIIKALEAASRPVILAGGGAASADAGKELGELIEKSGLPLVFTPTASDLYGSSHPLSIGAIGSIGGTRAGNFTIQNADYILAIGTKLCSQATGRTEYFAREAVIDVVDIDPTEHSKNGVAIRHLIHADAKEFLQGLLKKEIPVTASSWSEKCLHWKSAFALEQEPFIHELKKQNLLDLYSVMMLLDQALPENATVITDAGFEELIVPSALHFKDGQICLFSASQGAMGYAIPAILGAHYAGRRNIIAFVGDGSFMMNMQELQVLSYRRVPVKLIVISNNMYAVIRRRQRDLFRTRTVGNDPSDGVPAPDFAAIASCFGFQYRRIATWEELEAQRHTLFVSDNTMELIEIMCTPDQNYFHESVAFNDKRRLIHRPMEDMSPFLDRGLMQKEMIIKMIE